MSPTADLDSLFDACAEELEFARRYDLSTWTDLGQGSFAKVVRLHDRDLGQDVAVKVFLKVTDDLRRRFQAEVVNAQRIVSTRVVRVHTVTFGTRVAWLQMEYVRGVDLEHELLRRQHDGQPLARAEALAYARAAVLAVADAHGVGVYHRDVKPSNFLIPAADPFALKLGDFGISKHVDAASITATGEHTGTAVYSAPELFDRRFGQVGPPVDVYSLGILVFQLLTDGEHPYEMHHGTSAMHYVVAHQKERPRRIREFLPDVTKELDAILYRCLTKNPEKRPRIGELASAVEGALQALSGEGRGSRRQAPVPRWALGAAGGAGVALLTVALMMARPVAYAGHATSPSTLPGTPTTLRQPAPGAKIDTPLSIRVEGEFVVLTNAGRTTYHDIRLVVTTADGLRHSAAAVAEIEPGEDVSIPVFEFTPAIATGARVAAAEVTVKGQRGREGVASPVR